MMMLGNPAATPPAGGGVQQQAQQSQQQQSTASASSGQARKYAWTNEPTMIPRARTTSMANVGAQVSAGNVQASLLAAAPQHAA